MAIRDNSPNNASEALNDGVASYSFNLWLCICALVGVLSILHIITLLVYYLSKRGIVKERSGFNTKLRRILHSIINVSRIVLYRVTLSTGYYRWNVAEGCVIFGYLLVLLVWEFINCYNPTTRETLDVQYWSIRAGVMAINQLTLLQILTTKNNVISLLTGITYEKLQIFHRVLGRISLAFVWLHFCSQIGLGLENSGLAPIWIIMGILTASCYTLIFFLSVYPFRKRYYEAFLILHVALAGIAVVAMCFHVNHTTRLTAAFIPYFVFWALDRTMRFARTVLNYVRSHHSRKGGKIDTIQLVSGSVVLITLHRKMYWKAGQNVFLTIPAVSRFPFEAHPFTIATIRDPPVKKILEASNDNNESDLLFIVRAKDGFTKRLVQWATQFEATAPSRLPLTLVDGPYGNPPDVNAFKNVILIAGGTGVSFTLPLFQSIVKNVGEIKKSLCRSVAFYWIVPNYEDLNWTASSLLETLKSVPESLQIDVHFYVTRHISILEKAEQGVLEGHPSPIRSEPLTHEFVTVKLERPMVRNILRQTVDALDDSVLVAVSGPASLSNDVRRALGFDLYGRPSVFKGANEIYLHVENDYT